MTKKPIFFTSDWHIGHAKSIEFDKRPFRDVDHMHEGLISRYNSTVPENGVCYFLGDMGNKPEDIAKVVNRLNGVKVLVLGNHDKGMTTMYNCGFDVVMWSASLMIMKEKVTMSHCPLLGVKREDVSGMKGAQPFENWHGEGRKIHRTLSVANSGQFHLHGHIHSRKGKPSSSKTLGRQYDVGVTANNYTPVSMSQIESWIAKTLKKEQSLD